MLIIREICLISILLSSINTLPARINNSANILFQFYLVLLIPSTFFSSSGNNTISILLSSINTALVSAYNLGSVTFQFYLVLLILYCNNARNIYQFISILLSSINTCNGRLSGDELYISILLSSINTSLTPSITPTLTTFQFYLVLLIRNSKIFSLIKLNYFNST